MLVSPAPAPDTPAMRGWTLLWLWIFALPSAAEVLVPLPSQPAGVAWPTESWPSGNLGEDVDAADLEAKVDALFLGVGRGGATDTRAVLVIRGGKIVLERYGEGFGPSSRFHSWSMAKSVTQSLIALLVREGRLAVDDRAPIDAWSDPEDPRYTLTLRHLLHMTTGLDNADGGGDAEALVAQVLFGEGSDAMGLYAADRPLLHDPGTHWAYSTGTSAILGTIISEITGPAREDTRAWMERELLEPLGIESLVLETDGTDHLVGGSHAWATARDWARLGLLYLRGGLWESRQILPGGWVDFTRTRAPAENNGTYGAHFWINHPPVGDQFPPLPGAPESTFMMSGNGGQYVVLAPSKDLIVVRLGEMLELSWDQLGPRMGEVVELFPDMNGPEAGE